MKSRDKILKLNLDDGRSAAVRLDKIVAIERDGREVYISLNGDPEADFVELYGSEREAARRYEAILRLLAEVLA